MNFVLRFLNFLETEPKLTSYLVAKKAYQISLQPYHGWITRQAFLVRTMLKLGS